MRSGSARGRSAAPPKVAKRQANLVEGAYTSVALTVQRTYPFALAILVAAFVSLYPYWSAEGMCDSGGARRWFPPPRRARGRVWW
jgi:hypothetical protein